MTSYYGVVERVSLQAHLAHISPRIFHCFLHGNRHFAGFATPHTNSTISISYYGQCRKTEYPTTLNDLGDPSNVN
jgi:hypothetical protein